MKQIISILLIVLSTQSIAQKNLFNWNSVVLNTAFSKQFEMKVGHLRAYEISNGFQPSFQQSLLQLGYEISKKWEINSGVLYSQSTARHTWRYFVRGNYSTKLGNHLRWTNSIQAEKHSANESRFEYRMIYNSRFALAKRMHFLRLSPSIAYTFFYNIGGDPIAHFNEAGENIGRSTPDGFHRYRIMLNLNSKINKYVSVSLYYLFQNEFNFGTDEMNFMNVKNPNTGRTARRFDKFQVIGTSLNVNLSFYKHQ